MASLGQYFLLIVRSFPIHPEKRKLTSQEEEFHQIIERKLWDAKETISITDRFNNAAFLNSVNEKLLLEKRNAYLMHRLFPKGPQWQAIGGLQPWYEFAREKIRAGKAEGMADLKGP